MARYDMTVLSEHGASGATARGGPSAEDLFDLGLRASAGRGCEMDLVAAHMWFNLAALCGHDHARVYRAEIAKELSRSEVALAQRKARTWLKAR